MKLSHLSDRHRDLLLAALLVLTLVLAPFSFAPGHASAANTNYYVNSASGSDSNSGTSASSPWKTLGPINSRSFGSGDVINLARGSSWTGAGGGSAALTINGSGASGSPITVQAYGAGANPIIRNTGTSQSRGLVVNGSWVVVQGLTISDAHESGIYVSGGAQHVIVQNNEVVNTGFGIRVDGQFNLVTRNNIRDLKMIVNTPGGDDDYGAQAVLLEGPNNEVSYNRMTNCNVPSYDYGMDGSAVEFFGNADNSSVHHNYSYNVNAFSEVGSGGGGLARNITVADNLIVQSGQLAVLHINGTYGSTVANFRFINNTVVDTGSQGGYSLFYISATPSDPNIFQVRNNIFYINNYSFAMQNSVPFAHDHNLYYLMNSSTQLGFSLGAGEKIADPQFVNVGGGDYHLKAGSPAIDSAASPAPFNTDYDGKAVPSGAGPDMGAYEYGGAPAPPGPTPTPPPPPPPSAEMLQNGSFENNTDPWLLKLNSSGNASVALDGSTRAAGSNSVRLSNIAGADANNVHNIQFRQDNVNMSGGMKYELVFWARSDANRTLQAVVQKQDSPYTLYGDGTVNLTTTWQRFSYTFTPGQSDTVFAGFNLAASGATVWIDGVSMRPAPGAAVRPRVYLPVINQNHS
jgi:hypothetical protein